MFTTPLNSFYFHIPLESHRFSLILSKLLRILILILLNIASLKQINVVLLIHVYWVQGDSCEDQSTLHTFWMQVCQGMISFKEVYNAGLPKQLTSTISLASSISRSFLCNPLSLKTLCSLARCINIFRIIIERLRRWNLPLKDVFHIVWTFPLLQIVLQTIKSVNKRC